jgi:large subunit ribosomal protein L24
MFRGLLKRAARPPKVQPEDKVQRWRIVSGDTVHVIAGKERGKRGVVKQVLRSRNAVLVEGLNLVKKHLKSTEKQKGGVVTKEAPIHVSNVALIDPTDGHVGASISCLFFF